MKVKAALKRVQWWILLAPSRRLGFYAYIVATSSVTLAVYFFSIGPNKSDLNNVNAKITKNTRSVSQFIMESKASRIGFRQEEFPDKAELFPLMRAVFEEAIASGLSVNSGNYTLTHDATLSLVRYDLSLPLKGSYGNVKQFITALLRSHPNIALTSASFSRHQVDEASVQAELNFSVYLTEKRP